MENQNIKKIPACIILILSGAFLFALANPNYLITKGFAPAAWIMYVPYFFLIKKSSLKNAWFYSGLYGALSIALYAYWLYNYNPLCIVITLAIGFAGMTLFGLLLKALQNLFKKSFWFVWFLCLCSFDYLRTLGFLGIHYGLAAYTQWNSKLLIQSASLFGVFGLNAVVIFSSALIFAFLSKLEDKKILNRRMISDNKHYEGATYVNYVSENDMLMKNTSLKGPVVWSALWFAVIIFMLVYGSVRIKKTQDYKTITVAAIQHNESPESNSLESFRESLQNLISLTDEALEINPGIDIVVWPETAFVPSVIYHYNQSENTERKRLVKYFLDYMNSRSPVFVTGNQHISVNNDGSGKKYYNSALVFTPGQNVIPPEPELYAKIHLVPFSESFPYQKYFPHIYKALLDREKFFWEPGKEIKVFSAAGLSFYTPICFEDTFPSLCRQAWKNGARAFLSLSNDSWSKSEACQYQHLGMAMFRAVENNVPVVISSVSGQTAVINQNGQIMTMAAPFNKTYVISDLPLLEKECKPTIYNKMGDFLGYGMSFLLLAVLLIRIFIAIMLFIHKRK